MPPLRPEAGEHEQRVVDCDRQPDEHDQLTRVWADRRDELAVEPENPECCQQRTDRENERDDRRHDRPEGDQQDDERERDRQAERGIEAAVDQLADLVVRERVVQRVDPVARVSRLDLGDQRRDRFQSRNERLAVARDARDDSDGCPIR